MYNQSILVVDDDIQMRRFLCDLLGTAGYNLYEAEDGEEALQIHNKHTLHLIVTDIYMPRMDGLDLISAIRKDNKSIPIIAVSGSWDYLETAELFGANTTLAKPFDSEELLDSVKSLTAWPLFA